MSWALLIIIGQVIKVKVLSKNEGSLDPRSNSGQSLVEFAVALPILLLLLVGAIDLGRLFYYDVAITGAAREGARAASVVANSDSEVRASVRSSVSSDITFPDSNIVVAPSPGRTSGQPVTVTVSYDFVAITPILGRIFQDAPFTISGSAATEVQ